MPYTGLVADTLKLASIIVITTLHIDKHRFQEVPNGLVVGSRVSEECPTCGPVHGHDTQSILMTSSLVLLSQQHEPVPILTAQYTNKLRRGPDRGHRVVFSRRCATRIVGP